MLPLQVLEGGKEVSVVVLPLLKRGLVEWCPTAGEGVSGVVPLLLEKRTRQDRTVLSWFDQRLDKNADSAMLSLRLYFPSVLYSSTATQATLE